MDDLLEIVIGVIILAAVSFFFTPSDNSMKVDFYEKMEQTMVEAAQVDNSLGGYFAAGIINTREGREILRAGIKESCEIEIEDWWVVKTINIREKGSDDEFEYAGVGLFGLTIFSDEAIEDLL